MHMSNVRNMLAKVAPVYQAGLFGAGSLTTLDPSFKGMERIYLEDGCWIDWLPGWVKGADALFERLVTGRPWARRSRWMYDLQVLEPRMTDHWHVGCGYPLDCPEVDAMRLALAKHYAAPFDSVGFNLYRDGSDSIAWHRDRITADIVEPIVPLVSLGEPRQLRFRKVGGGKSRAFGFGHGDLLVTGGLTQRRWEHAVLKVAKAGPRISIGFRWGREPR